MPCSVSLVERVVREKGLDQVTVLDRSGNVLVDAVGASECLQLVQDLNSYASGLVRVEAAHQGDLTAGGRPKKGAQLYTWEVQLDQLPTTNGAPVHAGPSWAELVDLKVQLAEQRIREEYSGKGEGAMERIAGLLEAVLTPGKGTALVNGPAAPAAGPAAAPPPNGAPTASGQDPRLRQALADVVKLYKTNPDAFAQYAPLLHNMTAGHETS